MRSTVDLTEAAIVAAVVVVLGLIVAVLLIRGIRRRREKRHRDLSRSRRTANTHYDILGEKTPVENAPADDRKRRRRRRRSSNSDRGGIDILRRDDHGTPRE